VTPGSAAWPGFPPLTPERGGPGPLAAPSNSGTAEIRIVGIPQLQNQSSFFNVEQVLTEKLRTEFIGRGKYAIVPSSTGVDALLTGVIGSVTLTPTALNQNQQATRYALILTVSAEFKDMHTNKVLWANPVMQYREEFTLDPTSAVDTTTFLAQNVNAQERMASELARALVSAILEAF